MENNSFKLDLVKILKDAPKGLKLWCDVYGEVEFDGVIDSNTNYAISFLCGEDDNDAVTSDGRLFYGYEDANCVLWPSKEHRTWKDWQSVLLKTGDIVFDTETEKCYALKTSADKCEYMLYLKKDIYLTITCLHGYRLRYATPEEKEKHMENLGVEEKPTEAENEKPDTPKFDPATLQPFDKVLVRNNFDTEWHAGFFQHTDETSLFPYVLIDGSRYTQVIPFNDDTKHLIGKKDNPPEFYYIY